MRYEVVLDEGETPNKCTIAPLAPRPDFRLIRVEGRKPLGALSSPILLHHEGECITRLRSEPKQVSGIASVDCIWRRLDFLLARIDAPLPRLVRIPDGFETAYPRRSENDTDPEGGLATIEAIFVASAFLGNWDPTLLSKYYFGRRFIEMNRVRFLDGGVSQAADPSLLPSFIAPERNSRQRRRDRGRKTGFFHP